MRKPTTQLFVLLMLVLVPLELACAYIAYETIGEIVSHLYFFAVAVNLAFIVVAIRYPRAGALGAVALGLAIVPFQLALGHRLLRVQVEASRIVAYAYEQRSATGVYPADLADYEYHDATTRKYVRQYAVDESVGGFFLAFRVGTESTSHSYSPDGGWSYYPD